MPTAGRFGKKQDLFLQENFKDMTVDELAMAIKKTPEAVIKRMAILGLSIKDRKDRGLNAAHDIKNSPYWKQLKSELTNEEMDIFIEHWKEIVGQFQEDILHTEKLQMMDLIKMEILMGRDLSTEKLQNEFVQSCRDRMKRIQKDADLSLDEKEALMQSIGMELGVALSNQKEIRKSYNELLGKKKDILKAMKSTREQRIERLQDANQNFSAWLTDILSNAQRRKQIGIEMEKMRLAMEVETHRISDWHEFEDGEVEQPLLTPDTIKDE